MRSLKPTCLALVCLFAGVACTSSEDSPGGGGAGDSGSSDDLDGDTDELGEPFKVSLTIPDVEPAVERTMCANIRLNNPEPIKVAKIVNTLSTASHHLVVSAVEDPTQTEMEPYECRPFRAVVIGAPLTVTQRHVDEIRMPEGVGFPLEANQLMNLEMHFINTTPEPLDVTAESAIYASKDPDNTQEASFIIVGNLDIKIPPMSEYELPFSYVPLPEEFADATFFAATGHTHQFGTGAHLQVAEGEGVEGRTIYNPPNFDWAEAELARYEPHFQVPEGGGFRFNCKWYNPTDVMITYGESAMQEMCFFWTYYYPRREGRRTLLTGVEAAYGGGNQDDAGAPDAGGGG